LREEHRLRVFENRVLHYIMRSLIIFTPHSILFGDKIKKNGMGTACSTYGGEERHIQILVGKPEGQSSVGRPRHRWKDNITIDLQEVGCGNMDWIKLAQDRDK
jgi:hypothetical protein